MGFSNWMYAWTALFPIAVLLYYFFRKKYEIQSISSTLFWEQSMQETKVSPYLKNLQRNALFYLQMAALLLLFFMLLGPFITKEEAVSEQTIFVVDTSATMLAEKDGISLFKRNQEAMKELAMSRSGQPITIVTTGKEPVTVIQEEKDNSAVIAAIDELAVSYEHEYMSRGIEFARSLATGNGADIQIYTDALDRSAIPEGDGSIAWTVNVGEDSTVNVSIDKFGALQTEDSIEAIVKIVNQSERNQEGNLQIKDAMTEKVLVEENFEVEKGQDLLVSFKDLPEVRAIRADISVDDDYEADNTAFFLLGNELAEVIVDGKLHELVKTVFEAVGLPVTTGSVTGTQVGAIAVTNDVALLEQGTEPIILIGRNDVAAIPTTGVITSTIDPLFSIADISEMYVSEVYPPIEGFTTIASVGDDPFIQKSERGDIVILADIEMTDWPLHPSFPLFIWSTLEKIRAEANTLGLFAPNERKAFIGGEMEIYSEKDEYVKTIVEGASFIAPARPGIYKIREDKSEKLLAVQLEDTEKEIVVGDSFRVNKIEQEEGTEMGRTMIGSLLLLPILLLLLIEWEVQRRRGYPN